MGKRGSENRNSRGHRDLARFVLMLLPGFMFVGLLAPAAVTVKPKAAEQSVEPEPVSFRNFTLRAPMQLALPVEPSESERTASVQVESLFSGARYMASDAERELTLPAVAAAAPASDEEIVLAANEEDAVDDYVSDAMLDDSMGEPALSVDVTPLWNPSIFDRIPGPLATGGYTQWDDFHAGGLQFRRGTPVPMPIPEPQTGSMVAVGLTLLALRARLRDRA